MKLRGVAFFAAVALCVLPGLAGAQQQQRPASQGPAQITAMARLALPERPQRSNDPEQETLALQLAETLGFACRGHEMWRWKFFEDDFPRAQAIVNAGERSFRDRGYSVAQLPVEVDTVTAMQARGAAGPDANILSLWYVSETGVDLTLCRLR